MKPHWIIGFLITCALAIFADAKRMAAGKPRKAQSQISRGKTRAQPALLCNNKHRQDCRMPRDIPRTVRGCSRAMTAELGEIAQAAREGKISRPSSGIPQPRTILRSIDPLSVPADAVPGSAAG